MPHSAAQVYLIIYLYTHTYTLSIALCHTHSHVVIQEEFHIFVMTFFHPSYSGILFLHLGKACKEHNMTSHQKACKNPNTCLQYLTFQTMLNQAKVKGKLPTFLLNSSIENATVWFCYYYMWNMRIASIYLFSIVSRFS